MTIPVATYVNNFCHQKMTKKTNPTLKLGLRQQITIYLAINSKKLDSLIWNPIFFFCLEFIKFKFKCPIGRTHLFCCFGVFMSKSDHFDFFKAPNCLIHFKKHKFCSVFFFLFCCCYKLFYPVYTIHNIGYFVIPH